MVYGDGRGTCQNGLKLGDRSCGLRRKTHQRKSARAGTNGDGERPVRNIPSLFLDGPNL